MVKLAVNNINNWIFVTGVPRSGTTFLGMNLSLTKEVDYIHEPFNPMCGIPRINKWYRYISSLRQTDIQKEYDPIIKSIFNYNFELKNNIPKKDPLFRKIQKSILGSRGPFYLRLAKFNPYHQAAIIKDPIGSLLTEYLYLNFQVKPVIVIKHPTSFIASLKRVNFWPTPNKLKDQTNLIKDYFAEETDFFQQDWSNPVLAAAAFWRIIYKVLLTQASKYPDWIVLTHEQLSQKPIETFEHLYHTLNLPWSEEVASKIRQQTQGNKSAEAKQGVVQDFQRNSADIFQLRRDSLSQDERQAIFDIVQDVALQVYDRASFAID